MALQKQLSLDTNRTLITWGMLLFLAVVWGLSFFFIKKIVLVLSPIQVGAGRVFLAGAFLLPWAYNGLKEIPKAKYKFLLLSGLLGNLIPAFIFSLVGSKLNSSLSGTLNATTPIFVLIIGAVFFANTILKNQMLGIIIGFVGSLILIVGSGDISALNFGNPYAFLTLLATLMYGFNVNIINKYLKEINALKMTSVAFLFVGLIAFVVLLTTDFFTIIVLPENRLTLMYLLILGGINTSLALVIFNYLLQITSPVFASTVTYLIPVVAIMAGIFDHEVIGLSHLIGMSVILFGVYLINKKVPLKK